jgi:hypothetical protein
MNKCKTSQRVNIVEVFLDQKTDFPRGWEMSRIQPVLMSQTIAQESCLLHTSSKRRFGTHMSPPRVTAEANGMEIVTGGAAPQTASTLDLDDCWETRE